jgi:hypothetical protein
MATRELEQQLAAAKATKEIVNEARAKAKFAPGGPTPGTGILVVWTRDLINKERQLEKKLEQTTA